MNLSIEDIYRMYLKRNIALDRLRDWLALYQWGLSEYEQELADEADVALAHLDDGFIDEESLRLRFQAALEHHTYSVASIDITEVQPYPSLTRSAQVTGTASKTSKQTLILVAT